MKLWFMTGLLAASALLTGPAMAAGDAAAGKAKAASCAMCHGPVGQGTQMGPKIAGMAPAQFDQNMKDYASGKKANPMMKAQASNLSQADIDNLAAYYASLK